MQIKKELIKREIAGDTVLVPVGQTVFDTNGLFMLNELGGFIWDLLPTANTKEDILQAILAEYEVTVQTAEEDLDCFMNQLEKLGIL